MTSSDKIKKRYDKSAKFYDKIINWSGYIYGAEASIRSLQIKIPIKAKILDLGCGTGLATGVLIKRFPKAEITGLDYSKEMLKVYKKKFPKNRSLIGDFNKGDSFRLYPNRKKIKLKPSSFDLIISTGAVTEYGEPNKIASLIYKLLKKEGTFIGTGVKTNLIGKIIGKWGHFKTRKAKVFASAFKSLGFSPVRVSSIHWMFFPTNLVKYVIKAKKSQMRRPSVKAQCYLK